MIIRARSKRATEHGPVAAMKHYRLAGIDILDSTDVRAFVWIGFVFVFFRDLLCG